mmetsp:Transcript_113284/g.360058  ORF Transcript_113284/g.360058 Transcript_113284/m.360058 type:complete len:290 (-) Transcript_113284:1484-2353(-)
MHHTHFRPFGQHGVRPEFAFDELQGHSVLLHGGQSQVEVVPQHLRRKLQCQTGLCHCHGDDTSVGSQLLRRILQRHAALHDGGQHNLVVGPHIWHSESQEQSVLSHDREQELAIPAAVRLHGVLEKARCLPQRPDEVRGPSVRSQGDQGRFAVSPQLLVGEEERQAVLRNGRAHDARVAAQRGLGVLQRRARVRHSCQHHVSVAPQYDGGVPQGVAIFTHCREHECGLCPKLLAGELQDLALHVHGRPHQEAALASTLGHCLGEEVGIVPQLLSTALQRRLVLKHGHQS